MTGPTANGTGTTSGSDRVELMWANGAITQKWVEVIVKATADTGLGSNDVFFFGNEIGDTGSSNTAGTATVTSSDTTATQTHGAALKANIPATNLFDFNKDGQVTGADTTDAQTHGTTTKTGLQLLQLGTPGPFAPPPGGDSSDSTTSDSTTSDTSSGDSALDSALSASSVTSSASLPAWVVNRLQQLDLNSGPIANFLEHLADADTPRAQAILVKADHIADALDLDDTLLDSILVELGLE